MKKHILLWQGCIITMAIYIISVVAVYFIAGDQFQYRTDSMESTQGSAIIGEMTKGCSTQQTFRSEINNINSLSIKFATFNRKNHGTVFVSLSDVDTGKTFFQKNINVATIKDNSFFTINIPKIVRNVKGKQLRLSISTDNLNKANAITMYYNNKELKANERLTVNGVAKTGTLCFDIYGKEPIFFGQHYFAIMGAVGLLIALYFVTMCRKEKSNRKSYGLSVIHAFTRYHFLLDQLVSRDFKTKYKRSVLGVLWSFLNPLLSMTVQYIVFSTIFKSDIPNFAVYLLVGIVFFNFFTEATSMGLTSITSNASLITKVYIPKYIFPISRVFSSGINFLLSLIPLFLVILFTGTKITTAALLLPFPIICMTIFCIGLSMFLAALMVFFRDTQFLWNVISMLWMYATPIFYPESILPAKYLFVFKLNPLYHFIRFARVLVLNGISPEPQAYLFCLIAAFVPFVVGALMFKKTQDKFILYI